MTINRHTIEHYDANLYGDEVSDKYIPQKITRVIQSFRGIAGDSFNLVPWARRIHITVIGVFFRIVLAGRGPERLAPALLVR